MPNNQTKQQGQESLAALCQEVETLENGTMIAIEDLEKRLDDVAVSPLYEADAWMSSLETVEVYTMEKPLKLKDSVRKIAPQEM